MPVYRRLPWMLLFLWALGVAGCEPYMSMTDQVPAETRRAAALLPESPRYVGMIDVETALRHLDELSGGTVADSLQRMDSPGLRAFLDATGVDPKTDVQAVYGTLEEETALSAVLFANLTPAQMNRFLDERPDAGRRTTYRDVPLYRVALGADPAAVDTLAAAFVDEGMIVAATAGERVRRMIDRHRAEERTGLGTNADYMTLVRRVGHGSTVWLAGRDVLESAFQDSTRAEDGSGDTLEVSQAGLQNALAKWTDRILGLSDVSSFEGRANEKVEQLRGRLREQAVSVTLTDQELRGQVYLTMEDNASASSVVDVAEGAVAVMKFSEEDLDERQRDLLDEIEIERRGAIVHIQFALDHDQIRNEIQKGRSATAVRRDVPSIHPSPQTIRRRPGINEVNLSFRLGPIPGATHSRMPLSTAMRPMRTGG